MRAPSKAKAGKGTRRKPPEGLPEHLLARLPEEAARRIALSLLDEAAAGCKALLEHDGGREKALHAFRVGLRRLRSNVRAYRPWLEGSLGKPWRRLLRRLARATTAARDADVQIEEVQKLTAALGGPESGGLARLVKRLSARQRRGYERAKAAAREFAAMQQRLRARLGRLRIDRALDGEMAPRTFAAALGPTLREHTGDLVAQLAGVRGKDAVEAAHGARIAAKRLRYVLEPLAAFLDGTERVIKQLKRLQDHLGEMRDLHLLAREAEQVTHGDESGLKALIAAASARSESLYGELRREHWVVLSTAKRRVLARAGKQLRADVEALARAAEARAGGPPRRSIAAKHLMGK